MKVNMLLPAKIRSSRLAAVVLTVSIVLAISWSLSRSGSLATSRFKITQSAVCSGENVSNLRPLPPAYSQSASNSNYCAERLGTPFLRDASSTSINYCSPASPSSLTCFRTHVSTERIDSFCIGTHAIFDQEVRTFRLNCALGDLTDQQVAAGVPAFDDFPSYWYETGPRNIFQTYVKLDPGEPVPSEHAKIPETYTILVRREGPSPINNVFHHLMQIFSIFLTLDVLQMVPTAVTGHPIFRPGDIENTRVLILDEYDEGPFFDQWKIFAKRPLMRMQNSLTDLNSSLENIIVPLPGAANMLWQDDWVPRDCEQSKLLQVFAQRMLNFYHVVDEQEPLETPIVLTFIDRTEKRSLVNKETYISGLKASYPNIHINLVNFASLSFAEQLRTIRKTDILAGVHGAGLTHSIFLRPSSAVVEIMPPNFNHKGFRNLAKLSGLRYYTTHAVEHVNYTTPKGWQIDDVFIEQDRFNGLMDVAITSVYHKGLRDDDVN